MRFPRSVRRRVASPWLRARVGLLHLLSGVGLPLLFAGVGSGCAPVPEAPTELSDLSRYLYREFDAQDPRVMEAGVRNMMEFLQTVPLDGERADRSFEPTDLQDEDVVAIERPDRALDLCLPVAIGGVSRHPIAAHARWTIQPDQTPAEASATFYDRTFPNEPDPACFFDRSCALLETQNHAERENVLLKVEFVLWKDFRWVEILDADDAPQGWAIVTRSWFDQSWEGENGQNSLLQSYATDMWLEQDDGTTWRYQTLWSESEISLDVTDDAVRATLRAGIDASFGRADDAIDGMLAE